VGFSTVGVVKFVGFSTVGVVKFVGFSTVGVVKFVLLKLNLLKRCVSVDSTYALYSIGIGFQRRFGFWQY